MSLVERLGFLGWVILGVIINVLFWIMELMRIEKIELVKSKLIY